MAEACETAEGRGGAGSELSGSSAARGGAARSKAPARERDSGVAPLAALAMGEDSREASPCGSTWGGDAGRLEDDWSTVEEAPRAPAAAGPSVVDFPLSTRPWGAGVVGGRGKQKTENRGGAGGPALRIRPRREKDSDLDHEIGIVGSKTEIPRMDLPRCPGTCSRSQKR